MTPPSLIWLLIALTGAADLVLLAANGMAVDWTTKWWPALVVSGLIGLAVLLRKRNPPAGRLFISVAQLCAFTHVGALLTYAGMAASPFPLADAALAHADAALGFDWRAWFALVHAHLWLHVTLFYAYCSFPAQVGVLFVWLCYVDQPRIDALLLSGILAIYILVPIMMLLPAVGAWTQHGVGLVEPWRADILALRSHALSEVGDTQGIVSFPSYHAVLGVLFIEAARGRKWLFRLLLPLNCLLIAAVMTEGAHYFVDLLGGVAVACCAILTTRFMLARGPAAASAIARSTTT